MPPKIDPQAKRLFQSWAESPIKFVEEAVEPFRKKELILTQQQREGFEALRQLVGAKIALRRFRNNAGPALTPEQEILAGKIGLSIMSGRGTGKDTFAALSMLWFLSCFPHALIPCTAPSAHQLRDVLWKECNQWLRQSAAKEWLTWQSDKIFFNESGGKEWFAVGRTANPRGTIEEQTETLSGFHSEYMMVVVDEASGIPDPVFTPLEGTLTQTCNFMLVIFNPTRSSGFAIDTQMKDRGQWVCLQWDAEQSELVTKESVANKERKFGRESNYFRINVTGVPPLADADTLIPWAWVMDAVDREVEPHEHDALVLGLDVGAGGDPSALVRRRGPKVEAIDEKDTPEPEQVVNWVMGQMFKHDPTCLMVDEIGWGWGIRGDLQGRVPQTVIGVNVAELPSEDRRFHRLRDELWWRVRERFESRQISIPNDDDLIGQLTTIKFEEPGGKIKIEGKKELRRRGLASPNKADALCLTEYYTPEYLRQMKRPSKTRDYAGASWKTV